MNIATPPPTGSTEPEANVEATLPLARPRSVVYWPRRDDVTMAGLEVVETLSGAAAGSRLVTAAAAVTCVLARYTGADIVRIGVRSKAAQVHRLAIAAAPQSTTADIAAAVAAALDRPDLICPPPDPPQDAGEPPFRVLVADAAAGETVPDYRQDANVIFDALAGTLVCQFNSRLFDRLTASRFLGHVAAFLDACRRSPQAPIAGTDYVAPDEAAAITALTCPPASLLRPDATLQSLFKSAAEKFAEATAVEAAGRAVSYRALDIRSDRLAAALAGRGIGRGARVGISLAPGIDQIAALIAVLKAGATAVPLDHSFPQLRLDAVMAAAKLDLMVTEAALADKYSRAARRALLSDLDNEQHTAVAVAGAPDDLVYILFTSGSTGTPKGVAMRQRTLINLVCWQNDRIPAEGRRTLNRSSMAFDVGFQEIFATLCCGGVLVVASQEERADVARLQALIGDSRIERLFAPPVLLVQLAETFDEKADRFGALRHVIASGEPLKITPALVRLFRACPAQVVNQYGPTETHVATSYELQGPSLRWPLKPPIGRPIANARVHVLDAAGHRCPFGVTGEIAIGGVLPAAGYINDEDGTLRRFAPDRFPGAAPGAVMYLTGDLGRFGSDGQIEFVGRKDDQVKLRGYRIELSDIEANAMAMPGVRLAAAALRARDNADAFIALFVEPQAGGALQAREVRSFLAERLPQHMVPGLGAIAIVAALPLNANGKIDRRRLPQLPTNAGEPDDAAPRSVEERVTSIWKRVIGVGDIDLDDDFVALGGHSLLAIQIVSLTNDGLDISVPVATLLQGGTLRRYLRTVRELLAAKAGNTIDAAAADAPDEAEAALHEVKLASALVVHAPYPAEARHFYHEVFERNVYLRHGVVVPDAGTVVDVGANIGLFAVGMLLRNGRLRVIAIEPAPTLVRALRRNTAHLSDRVQILDVGLGGRDGTAPFTYYPALTGMSSFFPDEATDRALLARLIAKARLDDSAVDRALADMEESYLDGRLLSRRLERPVRRLSSIIAAHRLEAIDLLKIDVQHGEEDVLDGIARADWPKIRQIVIEHQEHDGSPLTARLEAEGFAVVTAQDDMHRGTDVVYSYATRPA